MQRVKKKNPNKGASCDISEYKGRAQNLKVCGEQKYVHLQKICKMSLKFLLATVVAKNNVAIPSKCERKWMLI